MPLFHLSTNDAARAPDPGDATWFLPFTDTSTQYETITVVSIGFTNPVKTINRLKNDQLSFTLTRDASTWTATATLPEGNYTGSSLATALTSAFHTVSSLNDWIAYDVNFGTLYLIPEVGHTRTLTFHAVERSAYTQLGVIPDVAVYTATNHLFSYPVNVHYSDYLDFVGNNFAGSDQFNSSGTQGVVARVPLDASFGNYILYEPKFPTPVLYSANSLLSITIQVLDQFGQPVVFPPNWPITYTFNLSFNS
jgi:hypothetical protein